MEDISHILVNDTLGMDTYEYIVNHAEGDDENLPVLIEHLRKIDRTGQFLASTARFLHAVDRERYDQYLETLVGTAIDRDRERKYIGSLLQALWGEDYEERAEELQAQDDNFRRIYKRLYPSKSSGNFGNLI